MAAAGRCSATLRLSKNLPMSTGVEHSRVRIHLTFVNGAVRPFHDRRVAEAGHCVGQVITDIRYGSVDDHFRSFPSGAYSFKRPVVEGC